MKTISIGIKGSFSKTIGKADLASELDSSLAQVMSTPTMIGMMELAAINAIEASYDAGESSVGMSIEVSHMAATPPGHRVRAEAELIKAEGRRLEFNVTAFDETEQIGKGIHRRAVIDAAKFTDRIKAKQKKLKTSGQRELKENE
jgi:predicted thioesterase